MVNWKLFLGSSLIILALSISTVYSKFTGAVIGINNFSSLLVVIIFISGILLLSSASLEERVEKKESLKQRIKKSLAARAVGATILAGAGAYGGHKAGEALQPYAKPIERAYQVTQMVAEGLIPGSAEFNEAVAKKYISEIGKEGKSYLLNRKSKDNKAYYRELQESLQLLQESAGNMAHKGTQRVDGLREAQNLKDRIYSKVGEVFRSKEIEARSSENYKQNYDSLAMRKINALIRLSQVNGQIDNTLSQLSMQAAKPSENKEALTYLGELAKEANTIYDFLDRNNDLSIRDIYEGERNTNYTETREIGSSIRGADYPLSDKLPYAGMLAGAAAGAYVGTRRRKIGETAIKSTKYIGKKARKVKEKIESRRKIK